MKRIAFISSILAVVASNYTREATDENLEQYFSVWDDQRGWGDPSSLQFMRFALYNKIMYLLEDALKTIDSDLKQSWIVSVIEGKIRPIDLPTNPKLKPTIYHVFFLAKPRTGGIYSLPVAETEEGKGWTKAQPSFYSKKPEIMEATHMTLKRGHIVAVFEYWHGVLSGMMPGIKEPEVVPYPDDEL